MESEVVYIRVKEMKNEWEIFKCKIKYEYLNYQPWIR